MPDSVAEGTASPSAAFLTAEQLGGPKTIGRQVRSDADLARAVELGFPTATIDALRKRGATDRDIAALIIKPRTLSHRRAKRRSLTVEESDRAVRCARVRALAEEAFGDGTRPTLGSTGTVDAGWTAPNRSDSHAGRRPDGRGALASIAWGAAL